MSVQAVSWALAQRIPPARKLVLISIANCADKNGDNAYPGQKTIAEDASVCVRSVRSHLNWLEEIGLLTRVYRCRKNGYRTSDRYVLHLDVVHVPPANLTSGNRRSPSPATGCRAMNRKGIRKEEVYREEEAIF